MTRKEFLDKLRAALGNDLSGAVIQENVDYYNSYISEETGKGRTEEEVIGELGDPWVLAQTIIDSVEGKNTVEAGYGESYRYSSGQKTYEDTYQGTSGGRQKNSGQPFGVVPWWKKLLVILGIIGVVMVVLAVIGGIIGLILPIVIPVMIIIAIIRLFDGRRRR